MREGTKKESVGKVVELCCGLGGATHGLLNAGLDVVKAYDLWPVAVKAHMEWHPEVPCEVRDVKEIEPEELRDVAVWASLPCHPWSVANQVTRGKDHPHYYSLRHFAQQVQFARVAVIENVAGLAQRQDGRAELLELRDECRKLGLRCSVQLISCTDHGVATVGKRTIIIIISPDGQEVEPIAPTERYVGVTKQRPLASEGLGRRGSTKRAREGKDQAYAIDEMAALQGVPVPSVARTNQYKLIGNAVPPRVAEAIARQVILPRMRGEPLGQMAEIPTLFGGWL